MIKYIIFMKLCIPVCVSFDCQIPDLFQHDPYVLIGCGGYKSDKMKFTDDIGDNISQWNQYVNEMSMIHWIGKNYNAIGNPEYVGISHYRRALKYEDWMLQPNAIICHAENYRISIYQSYCYYHVKSDFDYIVKQMQSLVSHEMFNNFIAFCQQSWNFEKNLFIMHKRKYMEYFEFINKFINLLLHDFFPQSDIITRDRYQKRSFAFLLERLTGFWIYDQLISQKSFPILVPIQSFDIESPYQRI